MPPEEELASPLDELRRNLMAVQEMADPIWEAAKGVRERLVRDGWSETYAEMLAFDWTSMLLAKIRESMAPSP